ncbi:MAG: hypothetical protein LUI12_05280 [Clostridiales bacterium]|nr:hypothetical protein [Clostridiales bacterium]
MRKHDAFAYIYNQNVRLLASELTIKGAREVKNVMENFFNRHIKCPWCGKGEILADGKAKVTVSSVCPKCYKIFYGDLDTLKSERGRAQKRKKPEKKKPERD